MTLVGAGEGGGFATSAKLKLDELFVTWLSYSDTCQFISSVISSFKLSPTISSPSSPQDSPILDGSSVISPRKFSPRKYNRSYTRNPPEASLSPNNNNNNNNNKTIIHAELDLNSLSPSLETKRNKTTSSYESIPRFYFPPNSQQGSYPAIIADDIAIPKIISSFSSTRVLSLPDALAVFESITPGLPQVVCRYMLDKEGDTRITEETITRLYKTYISGRDAASVIFEVLKQPADTTTTTTTTTMLQASDFRPFIRLILDSHPGLSFLNNTPEFQERYLETILVRIFYNAPRGIIGKMNLGQLRKSGLVSSLIFIENENDINKSIELFSYEHFYVIYCKFWEVDTDHDLIISAEDLMRYSGGPPTKRVAERIATVPIFPRDPDLARVVASKMRRVRSNNINNKKERERGGERGLMTYQDFVWFILSEEDRETNAALEYWFRILDLDEDGCWSSFELEYFYADMMPHLRDLGMDPPPFSDLLCQWLDMLSPEYAEHTTAWDCPRVQITMADLRKSKLAKSIIHSLVSPNKFLSFETKDPFAEPRDGVSDWVRFALVEYELAVADQADQHNHHSDDDT